MVSKWGREVARDVSRRLIQGPDRWSRQRDYGHTRSLPAERQVVCFLTESERHNARVPNVGLSKMPLDPWLSGRMERRLPIIVAVRLAPCAPASVDGEEKTYTDNVSPRGARIFSKHAWQPGETLRVTLLNGHSSFGNVVYCQRLPDDRYSIGVNFRDHPVTWSTVWRYGDA